MFTFHFQIEPELVQHIYTHKTYQLITGIQISALYVPESHIRLFSQQVWLDDALQGSKYTMRKHVSLIWTGKGSKLVVSYHPNNILPTLFVSQKETPTINVVPDIVQPESADIFSPVATKINQNLTSAQKELLVWNWNYPILDPNVSNSYQ